MLKLGHKLISKAPDSLKSLGGYMQLGLMAFAFIFLGILSSCFALREPAVPTATTSWISPTEPDVLLDNFRQAITTLNLVNYERCFRNPGFRYVPDPSVSGQNVGIFQRWTIQEELEYLKNLRNNGTTLSNNRLELSNPRQIFLNADSLEYTATYSLQMYHADTSFNKFQFQGNVLLTLVRNRSNEWAIRNWQDTKGSSNPFCWTDLKQHFVSP